MMVNLSDDDEEIIKNKKYNTRRTGRQISLKSNIRMPLSQLSKNIEKGSISKVKAINKLNGDDSTGPYKDIKSSGAGANFRHSSVGMDAKPNI